MVPGRRTHRPARFVISRRVQQHTRRLTGRGTSARRCPSASVPLHGTLFGSHRLSAPKRPHIRLTSFWLSARIEGQRRAIDVSLLRTAAVRGLRWQRWQLSQLGEATQAAEPTMTRASELVVSAEHVRPIGCERALTLRPRVVPHEIQDEGVGLAAAREVLPGVVDDPVGADRAEHVELPGRINTGHDRSVRLGQLHRESPHGATRAVDQDLCPGRVRPSSRIACTASEPEVGTAAACSNVIEAGFRSSLDPGMAANSARAPPWRHRFPTRL